MNTENEEIRIVSLIPSATEIVVALGYGDRLVGRSHECDYPSFVKSLPICTEPKFDPVGTSEQIHQRVTELLSSALSVYRVKTDVLAALAPTHIITQAQCEVCAVSLSDVKKAVADLMSAGEGDAEEGDAEKDSAERDEIEVVSLQPERLADVWTDMMAVAAALGQSETAAKKAIAAYKERLPNASSETDLVQNTRPKVACIEWTQPLMAAGNWVPELVELAGGIDCLGTAGAHSAWTSWEELAIADPDIIIVLPCGYDLAQTQQATDEMANNRANNSRWHKLKAVKSGQVYLADGNQYFNRPGPRLVESYEILAEIIQGKAINPQRASAGWQPWQPSSSAEVRE